MASAVVVLMGWGVVGAKVEETLPEEQRTGATEAKKESESCTEDAASASSASAEVAAPTATSATGESGLFTLSDSHPFAFLRLLSGQAKPTLRKLTWLHALAGIPDQAFITFQFAMGEKLKWGPDHMGTYLSCYGLVNVLMGRGAVDWLMKKFGTIQSFQFAKVASILGTGGLGGALAPSTTAMYALLLINPLSEAASPALKTMMASEASHIGKGTLAAMLSNLEVPTHQHTLTRAWYRFLTFSFNCLSSGLSCHRDATHHRQNIHIFSCS
jgi:hypothetical protein